MISFKKSNQFTSLIVKEHQPFINPVSAAWGGLSLPGTVPGIYNPFLNTAGHEHPHLEIW